MEIRGVGGNLGQRVVDLIIEIVFSLVEFLSVILALAEWHLPVAVEGAGRVDADRQGFDLSSGPTAGEKSPSGPPPTVVPVVPVDAQDQIRQPP